MIRIVLGFVLGLLIIPIVAFVYIHHGHPPVAVADQPFPMERQIAHAILNRRIDAEAPAKPLAEANEATFIAGAHIYREQCAFCHGLSGQPSNVGKNIFPDAPPLWEKHHHGDVVGVSDDPPGETYWKVANGIRLTGMPAYKSFLTETQMWQVSILLANADKPLPPAALAILKEPLALDIPTAAPAPITPPAKPAKPAAK